MIDTYFLSIYCVKSKVKYIFLVKLGNIEKAYHKYQATEFVHMYKYCKWYTGLADEISRLGFCKIQAFTMPKADCNPDSIKIWTILSLQTLFQTNWGHSEPQKRLKSVILKEISKLTIDSLKLVRGCWPPCGRCFSIQGSICACNWFFALKDLQMPQLLLKKIHFI